MWWQEPTLLSVDSIVRGTMIDGHCPGVLFENTRCLGLFASLNFPYCRKMGPPCPGVAFALQNLTIIPSDSPPEHMFLPILPQSFSPAPAVDGPAVGIVHDGLATLLTAASNSHTCDECCRCVNAHTDTDSDSGDDGAMARNVSLPTRG